MLSYRINLACHIRAEVKSNTAAVATIESRRPGTRWLGKNVDSEALALCRDELDLLLRGASTVQAVAVDEEKLHAQAPDSCDASDLLDNLNRSGTLHDPIGAARVQSAIRLGFSMLTSCPRGRLPARSFPYSRPRSGGVTVIQWSEWTALRGVLRRCACVKSICANICATT